MFAMPLSPTVGPASISHAAAALLHRLVDGAVARLVAPVALHVERLRLREELSGLDHRELKDLGISDLETFLVGWNPRSHRS